MIVTVTAKPLSLNPLTADITTDFFNIFFFIRLHLGVFFHSVNAATGQRWCRQGQHVLWLPADPTNPLRLQSASAAFQTKSETWSPSLFFFLLTCSMKQRSEQNNQKASDEGNSWVGRKCLFFIVLKMHSNIRGLFFCNSFQLRIMWCHKDVQFAYKSWQSKV